MTAATLKKYRTITYDDTGKPASVTLNLKNREMKRFYEVMMEDFMDMMAVKEAMKNDDGTRYELVKSEDGSFTFVECKQ